MNKICPICNVSYATQEKYFPHDGPNGEKEKLFLELIPHLQDAAIPALGKCEGSGAIFEKEVAP